LTSGGEGRAGRDELTADRIWLATNQGRRLAWVWLRAARCTIGGAAVCGRGQVRGRRCAQAGAGGGSGAAGGLRIWRVASGGGRAGDSLAGTVEQRKEASRVGRKPVLCLSPEAQYHAR
jgi:hypothetical protein